MTTHRPIATTTPPEWLPTSEYPFELHSVDVGEIVTYIDEGEGPVLLFVHTGMWSFIFRDVILRTKDDFRCIALDFPGFGLSPDPKNEDLDLEAQSELLTRFVDRLALDDVTLILHDLGGVVGMGFAAAQPERIRGFVMANTFAWKPDGKALIRMLKIVSSRAITAIDRTTRFIPRMSATRSGVGRHLSREGKDAFIGPFKDRQRIGRFHSTMRNALESSDLYERIETATSGALKDRPILTIFGEKNDPFGFEDRHHKNFSNHESVVVEGGNHFPMMDDPDLFAESIRSWWNRTV